MSVICACHTGLTKFVDNYAVCKILKKYFRKGQVNNVQLLQLTSFVAYFTSKKAAIQQQVLVWQQGNGQVKSNLLA